MTALKIIEYPDPRLRETAEPVTEFDASVSSLVSQLIETMHESKNIGLSAPQVAVASQILVMDLSPDQSAPEEYINPVILAEAAPGFVAERCASVPGVTVNVLRATRVRVRAQNRAGYRFDRELEGMAAVVLQHEMDHMVGKLLIDRVSWLRRWRVRSRLERAARQRTPEEGHSPSTHAAA